MACCQAPALSVSHIPDGPPTAASDGYPLLSVPPLATSLSDVKGILNELRRETEAAAIRQEDLLTEMFEKQAHFHEEMRSTANVQLVAQDTLRKSQEDMYAAFNSSSFAGSAKCKSPVLITSVDGPKAGEANGDAAQGKVENQVVAAGGQPSRQAEPLSPKEARLRHRLSFSFLESDNHKQGNKDTGVMARLDRLLHCTEFEGFVAFAIMANAIVMFWEGQYHGLDVGFRLQYPGRSERAHVAWPNATMTFSVLEWCFGVLFTTEAVVKMTCWKLNYLKNRWNLLDLLCVVSFLYVKLAVGSFGFNPQVLRLLRLLRLARLVRLLRFIEHLDHLYVMTMAIAGMGALLGWATLLLTVMLLACDLGITQILQATYFSNADAGDLTGEQLQKHHEMYSYFGTCSRCMLSMFEITLGNWPPVARLLSEEVSEWFALLLIIHKLTIGFGVIGVITGVILQETFKVALTDDVIMLRARKRASTVIHKKMEALFHALDTDEDGLLQREEFEELSGDPNVRHWLASMDIETDDLGILFELIDENKDGSVSLEEIVSRMPRIRGTARSMDVLALTEAVQDLAPHEIATQQSQN